MKSFDPHTLTHEQLCYGIRTSPKTPQGMSEVLDGLVLLSEKQLRGLWKEFGNNGSREVLKSAFKVRKGGGPKEGGPGSGSKPGESFFSRCRHDPKTGYCLPGTGWSGGESSYVMWGKGGDVEFKITTAKPNEADMVSVKETLSNPELSDAELADLAKKYGAEVTPEFASMVHGSMDHGVAGVEVSDKDAKEEAKKAEEDKDELAIEEERKKVKDLTEDQLKELKGLEFLLDDKGRLSMKLLSGHRDEVQALIRDMLPEGMDPEQAKDEVQRLYGQFVKSIIEGDEDYPDKVTLGKDEQTPKANYDPEQLPDSLKQVHQQIEDLGHAGELKKLPEVKIPDGEDETQTAQVSQHRENVVNHLKKVADSQTHPKPAQTSPAGSPPSPQPPSPAQPQGTTSTAPAPSTGTQPAPAQAAAPTPISPKETIAKRGKKEFHNKIYEALSSGKLGPKGEYKSVANWWNDNHHIVSSYIDKIDSDKGYNLTPKDKTDIFNEVKEHLLKYEPKYKEPKKINIKESTDTTFPQRPKNVGTGDFSKGNADIMDEMEAVFYGRDFQPKHSDRAGRNYKDVPAEERLKILQAMEPWNPKLNAEVPKDAPAGTKPGYKQQLIAEMERQINLGGGTVPSTPTKPPTPPVAPPTNQTQLPPKKPVDTDEDDEEEVDSENADNKTGDNSKQKVELDNDQKIFVDNEANRVQEGKTTGEEVLIQYGHIPGFTEYFNEVMGKWKPKKDENKGSEDTGTEPPKSPKKELKPLSGESSDSEMDERIKIAVKNIIDQGLNEKESGVIIRDLVLHEDKTRNRHMLNRVKGEVEAYFHNKEKERLKSLETIRDDSKKIPISGPAKRALIAGKARVEGIGGLDILNMSEEIDQLIINGKFDGTRLEDQKLLDEMKKRGYSTNDKIFLRRFIANLRVFKEASKGQSPEIIEELKERLFGEWRFGTKPPTKTDTTLPPTKQGQIPPPVSGEEEADEGEEETTGKTGITPPPKPGTVRFYHGGVPFGSVAGDKSRWLTQDADYAQSYAEKSNGGIVQYVDIPENHPILADKKAFDDTGTRMKSPYAHFDAPEEIASQLKPYISTEKKEVSPTGTESSKPPNKTDTTPPPKPVDHTESSTSTDINSKEDKEEIERLANEMIEQEEIGSPWDENEVHNAFPGLSEEIIRRSKEIKAEKEAAKKGKLPDQEAASTNTPKTEEEINELANEAISSDDIDTHLKGQSPETIELVKKKIEVEKKERVLDTAAKGYSSQEIVDHLKHYNLGLDLNKVKQILSEEGVPPAKIKRGLLRRQVDNPEFQIWKENHDKKKEEEYKEEMRQLALIQHMAYDLSILEGEDYQKAKRNVPKLKEVAKVPGLAERILKEADAKKRKREEYDAKVKTDEDLGEKKKEQEKVNPPDKLDTSHFTTPQRKVIEHLNSISEGTDKKKSLETLKQFQLIGKGPAIREAIKYRDQLIEYLEDQIYPGRKEARNNRQKESLKKFLETPSKELDSLNEQGKKNIERGISKAIETGLASKIEDLSATIKGHGKDKSDVYYTKKYISEELGIDPDQVTWIRLGLGIPSQVTSDGKINPQFDIWLNKYLKDRDQEKENSFINEHELEEEDIDSDQNHEAEHFEVPDDDIEREHEDKKSQELTDDERKKATLWAYDTINGEFTPTDEHRNIPGEEELWKFYDQEVARLNEEKNKNKSKEGGKQTPSEEPSSEIEQLPDFGGFSSVYNELTDEQRDLVDEESDRLRKEENKTYTLLTQYPKTEEEVDPSFRDPRKLLKSAQERKKKEGKQAEGLGDESGEQSDNKIEPIPADRFPDQVNIYRKSPHKLWEDIGNYEGSRIRRYIDENPEATKKQIEDQREKIKEDGKKLYSEFFPIAREVGIKKGIEEINNWDRVILILQGKEQEGVTHKDRKVADDLLLDYNGDKDRSISQAVKLKSEASDSVRFYRDLIIPRYNATSLGKNAGDAEVLKKIAQDETKTPEQRFDEIVKIPPVSSGVHKYRDILLQVLGNARDGVKISDLSTEEKKIEGRHPQFGEDYRTPEQKKRIEDLIGSGNIEELSKDSTWEGIKGMDTYRTMTERFVLQELLKKARQKAMGKDPNLKTLDLTGAGPVQKVGEKTTKSKEPKKKKDKEFPEATTPEQIQESEERSYHNIYDFAMGTLKKLRQNKMKEGETTYKSQKDWFSRNDSKIFDMIKESLIKNGIKSPTDEQVDHIFYDIRDFIYSISDTAGNRDFGTSQEFSDFFKWYEKREKEVESGVPDISIPPGEAVTKEGTQLPDIPVFTEGTPEQNTKRRKMAEDLMKIALSGSLEGVENYNLPTRAQAKLKNFRLSLIEALASGKEGELRDEKLQTELKDLGKSEDLNKIDQVVTIAGTKADKLKKGLIHKLGTKWVDKLDSLWGTEELKKLSESGTIPLRAEEYAKKLLGLKELIDGLAANSKKKVQKELYGFLGNPFPQKVNDYARQKLIELGVDPDKIKTFRKDEVIEDKPVEEQILTLPKKPVKTKPKKESENVGDGAKPDKEKKISPEVEKARKDNVEKILARLKKDLERNDVDTESLDQKTLNQKMMEHLSKNQQDYTDILDKYFNNNENTSNRTGNDRKSDIDDVFVRIHNQLKSKEKEKIAESTKDTKSTKKEETNKSKLSSVFPDIEPADFNSGEEYAAAVMREAFKRSYKFTNQYNTIQEIQKLREEWNDNYAGGEAVLDAPVVVDEKKYKQEPPLNGNTKEELIIDNVIRYLHHEAIKGIERSRKLTDDQVSDRRKFIDMVMGLWGDYGTPINMMKAGEIVDEEFKKAKQELRNNQKDPSKPEFYFNKDIYVSGVGQGNVEKLLPNGKLLVKTDNGSYLREVDLKDITLNPRAEWADKQKLDERAEEISKELQDDIDQGKGQEIVDRLDDLPNYQELYDGWYQHILKLRQNHGDSKDKSPEREQISKEIAQTLTHMGRILRAEHGYDYEPNINSVVKALKGNRKGDGVVFKRVIDVGDDPIPVDVAKKVDSVLSRLSEIVGRGDSDIKEIHIRLGSKLLDGRANLLGGILNLGVHSDSKTIIHEICHLLIQNIPGLFEACQAFWQANCGNDEPVDLEKEYGDVNYRGEVGYSDDFGKVFKDRRKYYAGKKYERNLEILSVGAEALLRNAEEFHDNRPDWFMFVVRALGGHYNTAPPKSNKEGSKTTSKKEDEKVASVGEEKKESFADTEDGKGYVDELVKRKIEDIDKLKKGGAFKSDSKNFKSVKEYIDYLHTNNLLDNSLDAIVSRTTQVLNPRQKREILDRVVESLIPPDQKPKKVPPHQKKIDSITEDLSKKLKHDLENGNIGPDSKNTYLDMKTGKVVTEQGIRTVKDWIDIREESTKEDLEEALKHIGSGRKDPNNPGEELGWSGEDIDNFWEDIKNRVLDEAPKEEDKSKKEEIEEDKVEPENDIKYTQEDANQAVGFGLVSVKEKMKEAISELIDGKYEGEIPNLQKLYDEVENADFNESSLDNAYKNLEKFIKSYPIKDNFIHARLKDNLELLKDIKKDWNDIAFPKEEGKANPIPNNLPQSHNTSDEDKERLDKETKLPGATEIFLDEFSRVHRKATNFLRLLYRTARTAAKHGIKRAVELFGTRLSHYKKDIELDNVDKLNDLILEREDGLRQYRDKLKEIEEGVLDYEDVKDEPDEERDNRREKIKEQAKEELRKLDEDIESFENENKKIREQIEEHRKNTRERSDEDLQSHPSISGEEDFDDTDKDEEDYETDEHGRRIGPAKPKPIEFDKMDLPPEQEDKTKYPLPSPLVPRSLMEKYLIKQGMDPQEIANASYDDLADDYKVRYKETPEEVKPKYQGPTYKKGRKLDLGKVFGGEIPDATDEQKKDLYTLFPHLEEYGMFYRDGVDRDKVKFNPKVVARLRSDGILEPVTDGVLNGDHSLTDKGASLLAKMIAGNKELEDPTTIDDLKKLQSVYGLSNEYQKKLILRHFGLDKDEYKGEDTLPFSYDFAGKLKEIAYKYHNPEHIRDRIANAHEIHQSVKDMRKLDFNIHEEVRKSREAGAKIERESGLPEGRYWDDYRRTLERQRDNPRVHPGSREFNRQHYQEKIDKLDEGKKKWEEENTRRANIREEKIKKVHQGVADLLRSRVPEDEAMEIGLKEHDPKIPEEKQEILETGLGYLLGGVKKGTGNVPDIRAYKAVKTDGTEDTRAHYSDGDINFCGITDGVGVAIHEICHGIEKYNPEIAAAIQEFRKHRVGDEKGRKMRDVQREISEALGRTYDPSLSAYDEDEVGYQDDFGRAFGEGTTQAYYVGKIYDENTTEILSMGVQKLFEDPKGFAENDPEYCSFILGILDGSFRSKPIPEGKSKSTSQSVKSSSVPQSGSSNEPKEEKINPIPNRLPNRIDKPTEEVLKPTITVKNGDISTPKSLKDITSVFMTFMDSDKEDRDKILDYLGLDDKQKIEANDKPLQFSNILTDHLDKKLNPLPIEERIKAATHIHDKIPKLAKLYTKPDQIIDPLMHEAKLKIARNVLRKDFASKDPSSFVTEVDPKARPSIHLINKKAVEYLQGLVGKGLNGEETPTVKVEERKGRAVSVPTQKKIMMSVVDHEWGYIHEFGHIIERHIPGVYRACKDFLDYRTKGEKPKRLSEFPGLKGGSYRDDEIAVGDEFSKAMGVIGPYAGKIYSGKVTEILSMGVQFLYTDPAGFAKNDPEYFAFVVGVLNGELRHKEIPKE